MSNRKRDLEKEGFWRLVMDEQRASGLSARAFCKQESLSEASFYFWRRELANRDQACVEDVEGSIGAQNDSRQQRLIPVSVVDLEPAVRQTANATPDSCSLEVLTPSGFTLRFDEHLEPTKLRVLLHTIASCGSEVSSC